MSDPKPKLHAKCGFAGPDLDLHVFKEVLIGATWVKTDQRGRFFGWLGMVIFLFLLLRKAQTECSLGYRVCRVLT